VIRVEGGVATPTKNRFGGMVSVKVWDKTEAAA